MSSLPRIAGLRLISEVRRDMFARWYRVDSTDPGLLVLFHDADAGRLAAEAARRLDGAAGGAYAPCTATGEHDGLPWFRVAAENGYDPLDADAFGELDSLGLLKSIAQAVAGLAARGEAHGALLQGGLQVLPGPRVQVLPPFLIEDWLAERLQTRLLEVPAGYRELSPSARDLAALTALCASWIGGRRPDAVFGPDAVPADLTANASPATAQVVRRLAASVGSSPDPSDVLQVLARVGWIDGGQRSAATATARERGPAPPPREPREPRERPRRARKRRIPAAVGVIALTGLAIGLVAIGGGDAFSDFVSGLKRPTEALPTPSDPLARDPGAVVDVASVDDDAVDATDSDAPAGSVSDSDTSALADRIVADLAKKKAERDKPRTTKKSTYDRTLIDEAEKWREEGYAILRDVRDRKVKHKDRNRRLEEAIGLLEKARENYIQFVEQYPDKERLVERTLEDVVAMLRIAYKSKSRS